MGRARPRRLIPGLFLLLAVASLAACGGGEDTAVTPGTSTASTSVGTETPSATETVSPELTALRSSWERVRAAPHTAWYDLDIDSGEPRTTLQGTLRAVLALPRLTIAFEGQSGAGQLLDFLYIETEDARYVCNVIDTRSQCLVLDQPSGALGEILDQLRVPDWVDRITRANVSVARTGQETVAGVASECFAFEGGEARGTLCLGIDLPAVTRLEGTITGTEVRIELTQYSPDVPPDAFEPPYPVSRSGN